MNTQTQKSENTRFSKPKSKQNTTIPIKTQPHGTGVRTIFEDFDLSTRATASSDDCCGVGALRLGLFLANSFLSLVMELEP